MEFRIKFQRDASRSFSLREKRFRVNATELFALKNVRNELMNKLKASESSRKPWKLKMLHKDAA